MRDGMLPLSKALIYNSELAAGVAGRFSQGTSEGYSARSLGLIRCSRKEGKSETRSNGASENGSKGTKRRGRNSISQKARRNGDTSVCKVRWSDVSPDTPGSPLAGEDVHLCYIEEAILLKYGKCMEDF